MLNWAIIGSGDVVNRLVQDPIVTKQSKVKYIYSYDQKMQKNFVKVWLWKSGIKLKQYQTTKLLIVFMCNSSR